MASISLDHVQQLADQLPPLDQVRLIEHLTTQIAHVVAAAQPTAQEALPSPTEAWAQLEAVFTEIGAGPWERETLATQALDEMRR